MSNGFKFGLPASPTQHGRTGGGLILPADWQARFERYRSQGNYGFTPFVTPKVFAELVAAGVLEPAKAIGKRQELYRVR